MLPSMMTTATLEGYVGSVASKPCKLGVSKVMLLAMFAGGAIFFHHVKDAGDAQRNRGRRVLRRLLDVFSSQGSLVGDAVLVKFQDNSRLKC